MAQQLDDTTTFQAFWANMGALPGTEQRRWTNAFNQFAAQTERFAMSQMIDALDGASDDVKSYLWKQWANKADLSGANIYDVLALKSEPPAAVAIIVQKWLEQVNLKNFSLKEMKVLTEDSAGLLVAEDVEKFWLRWITTTDLRMVTLAEFAKAMRGLPPEIQLSCLNTYAANHPSISLYGSSDRLEAKKYLSQWATSQCSLFAGSGTANAPKFRAGQRVRVPAQGAGIHVVATICQNSGTYYYWLEHGQKYVKETDLVAA